MLPPSSHTTVQTVPYTAVHDQHNSRCTTALSSASESPIPPQHRPRPLPDSVPLPPRRFGCHCRFVSWSVSSSISAAYSRLVMFSPSVAGQQPTMASADFCRPIPSPSESGSHWQDSRPPRVMRTTFPLIPAAYTSTGSVQVSGFESIGPLTHHVRLVCDSCSSGQWFAFGFLQIPLRNGHPCRSANRSPCRAGNGLAPPSHPATTTCAGIAPVKALRAMPGAPKKTAIDCKSIAV